MWLVVGFSCDGDAQQTTCTPDSVELLFIANTTTWVGGHGSSATLLVDGEPENLGKADWDGQVLNADDLIEYYDLDISPALLRRMAKAQKIEVQLGVMEFALTDENLYDIRDIASHLKAEAPPKAPTTGKVKVGRGTQ